jgi:hypothetical protein
MMTKPRILGGSGPPYDVRHADPVDHDVEGVLSPSSCVACLASQFQDAPLACLYCMLVYDSKRHLENSETYVVSGHRFG